MSKDPAMGRNCSAGGSSQCSLAVVAAVSALCALAMLGALAAQSRAAEPNAAASAFAVRTVGLLVENRYAAAWRTLHPSHRRAIGGRTRYVECELSAPITETAISIEGIGVRDRKASIAGIGRVRAKAVTLRIEFADAAVPEGVPVTLTVHGLQVRGAWRWVLPNASDDGYVRGGCG